MDGVGTCERLLYSCNKASSSKQDIVHYEEYQAKDIFTCLFSDDEEILNQSILSLQVEAFDGEVAMFINMSGKENLVARI